MPKERFCRLPMSQPGEVISWCLVVEPLQHNEGRDNRSRVGCRLQPGPLEQFGLLRSTVSDRGRRTGPESSPIQIPGYIGRELHQIPLAASTREAILVILSSLRQPVDLCQRRLWRTSPRSPP